MSSSRGSQQTLPRIHVVAGIIRSDDGSILIAERPTGRAHAGLWEFPGGKCEPNESAIDALARELHEELGIDVTAATSSVLVEHDYAEISVRLDVYEVDAWRGTPSGREGQRVRFVSPRNLSKYEFPAANRAALTALQLPRYMLITPSVSNEREFLSRLEQRLSAGVRLIQFRDTTLSVEDYRSLATEIAGLCGRWGATLMLNCAPDELPDLANVGLHLNSARLQALRTRPCSRHTLLSASCHDPAQIACAASLGVDFITIAPIEPTASHPRAVPLGWRDAQTLAGLANLPTFALGGMGINHLKQSVDAGFHGVAMIRRIWDAEPEALSDAINAGLLAARAHPSKA